LKAVAKQTAAITLCEEVMTVAEPRTTLGNIHTTPARPERLARTRDLLDDLTATHDRSDVEEELICLNLGVARDIARRYHGRGIAADDLEQVAYVGLVKAVQHFDPAKGGEFLSFAVPTIRGELRRWFRDAGWTVRPPRSVQELQARISRAESELAHDLGRPPGPAEIAEDLDEDEIAVRRAMAVNGCFRPASLDAPVAGEEEAGSDLARTLGGPDPGFEQVDARVALQPLLRDLDDRERLMIRMRFVEGATQSEIGEQMGVTQTQVSRLMSALLTRLRHELEEEPVPVAV
jgi:RNA polymerase sigma-B factor